MMASCPRKRNPMMACVITDGESAFTLNAIDQPVCAGCSVSEGGIGIIASPTWWERRKKYYNLPEKSVPAPAPSINFYVDVIEKDPRFHSLSPIHDTGLLEPTFWKIVQGFMVDAAAEGHHVAILETYRSEELQKKYFDEHRTQLEKVGVHHYGLAIDLVVILASGEADWAQEDYDFFGGLAIKYKLIWGRDWGEPERQHSLVDSVHLQRVTVADEDKLFTGWYPPVDYQPAEVG